MGVPSPSIQTQGVGHLLGHLQFFWFFRHFFDGSHQIFDVSTGLDIRISFLYALLPMALHQDAQKMILKVE